MMLDDALFAASRCNGLRGGDRITDGTPRHSVVRRRNDFTLWPLLPCCGLFRGLWRQDIALTLAVSAVSLMQKGIAFLFVGHLMCTFARLPINDKVSKGHV